MVLVCNIGDYRRGAIETRAVGEGLKRAEDGNHQYTRKFFRTFRESIRDDAVPYSTVAYWVAEFKRGRSNCKDDPRSGRRSTSCAIDRTGVKTELQQSGLATRSQLSRHRNTIE
ncbi:hypothetical protein K1T71_005094 [Dendrolimus kikuchii]|uniref:Uncharacterized protein n=1 Tax=Dendrolimus kikuchii TaxID=765133 RepID=A0ACC1D766_9NEOP|nr:hypothetical protein K1T71_005094 [Dendrolimus kikuchii]